MIDLLQSIIVKIIPILLRIYNISHYDYLSLVPSYSIASTSPFFSNVRTITMFLHFHVLSSIGVQPFFVAYELDFCICLNNIYQILIYLTPNIKSHQFYIHHPLISSYTRHLANTTTTPLNI